MIGITKVCVYISHCAGSRRVGFSFLPVPLVIVIEVFPAKPTLAVKIHRNIVIAGTNCACHHVYGAVIVAGRVRDISLSIAVACSANEYVCANCPRFGLSADRCLAWRVRVRRSLPIAAVSVSGSRQCDAQDCDRGSHPNFHPCFIGSPGLVARPSFAYGGTPMVSGSPVSG